MSRTKAQYVRPLTDAERRVLQDNLRSSEAFVARRARIVLASAAGEHSEQIAPCVGGTTHGVRAVIRAFNARGLDALRPGSHHPDVVSTFDAPQSEAPPDLLHQSPRLYGTATSVWTLERAAVAQEQGGTAERGSDVGRRFAGAHLHGRIRAAAVHLPGGRLADAGQHRGQCQPQGGDDLEIALPVNVHHQLIA